MIDTTRVTRRTEDFIIKNTNATQPSGIVNPYGLKYRAKKQATQERKPAASMDTGSYWMNNKLAKTQNFNSTLSAARLQKVVPREVDNNVTDIYNVDTWIEMKKMGKLFINSGSRVKIDDILILARKTKTDNEVRQEERIFIPKMNVKMMDSIMRHTSQPRTFASREITTLMDLQRLSPKNKNGKANPEAMAKEKELKDKFEMSQVMLNKASDAERIQDLLRSVVINKIEKDLELYKKMATLKERQKYLETVIKEYCGNFDTFRRLFSNPKHDSFIEQKLLTLVSKDSLEDIEKEKSKRDSLDLIRKELVFKNYETMRNDISARETMLEACGSLEKLIEESKSKVSRYTTEKIDCSMKIKYFHQEMVLSVL